MTGASDFRSRRASHWDAAYASRDPTEVSWFQPTVTTSLDLVEALKTAKDAAIVDVGGGASLLVDALAERRYHDVSVLDISSSALESLAARLGTGAPVELIHHDLLGWRPHRQFDLWHDRAVFHFMVEQADRAAYLRTLRSVLRTGGGIIVATFAPDGPEICSGVPVARYSSSDLQEVLGPDFAVVEELREIHVTPTGAKQPFTWLAARRTDPRHVFDGSRNV